jgi:predicted naringenin-chalcone synthase
MALAIGESPMAQPIVALTNFTTIQPELSLSQAAAIKHTIQTHEKYVKDISPTQIAKLFRRYGVKDSRIHHRLFESVDMGARNADIHERTSFFSTRAQRVFNQFYSTKENPPDHIVHVTCTGYISPSAPQRLVDGNDWHEKTKVTHAYHMGCYAALPAIRMAEGLASASGKNVDVVHTEMCALHFRGGDLTPEQIVVQSLFADGHIKYSAVDPTQTRSGFLVLNVEEQIVKDSHADMSWSPAPWGMTMNLSREVPEKISASLRGFMKRLVEKSGMSLAEALKSSHFAIHPGGPKIIDAVQDILELRDTQTQASRDILFNRGNMSSATLPHIWQKMLQDGVKSKERVISLAFGPGLTIFGSVFEAL